LDKDVRPKRSLGQHFLTDTRYCERFVQFAELEPDDTVIEIGPGTGQLTEFLIRQVRQVIGVEFDSEMVDLLKNRYSVYLNQPHPQLEIIQADVLQVCWSELLDQLLPNFPTPQNLTSEGCNMRLTFVGNLPYNIATRIMTSMTEIKHRFQSLVFMTQKEVANRILASPGTKDYGYFTLLMEYNFRRQKGFDVPPGAFFPPPKVMSHVLRMLPREGSLTADEQRLFRKVIQTSFQQRRKTLWNNLKLLFDDEVVLREAFQSCAIDLRARPEQVDLAGYLGITRVLSLCS
jgi:16S rRNA (adenine1518-N6/adenine1519-N6)-dimethyltransferase